MCLIIAAAVVAPLATVGLRAEPSADAALELGRPVRVLDTRSGLGADRGRLQRGEVLRLRIPGVPIKGETVALLNLTSVGATQPGNISAWPCASGKPDTSILNYEPGRAIPNMVALEYTSDGLCFASTSSVHVIADVTGVTTEGDLHGIRPQRLVDTRRGTPYRAGREYRVKIAGTTGIPAGAVGAAVNVTVVAPGRAGNLIVKPCGSPSDASSVNFLPGEVVPHFTFAKLASGALCITSSTDANVIVDSFGWTDSSSDVRMVTPDRLLDTRNGKGGTFGAVRDGQLVRLRVAGESGVPNDAQGVTVNIVATGGSALGYVAAWPCHVSQPDSSTLNLWPGMVRSNQATLQLSPAGELCFRAKIVDSSRVHLVVDAVGYLEGDEDRPPPPVTTPPTTPPPTTPPPTTPPPTTPPPTTPPPNGRFETLPPGSALPSGAECASRVRSAPENRPQNAAENGRRGQIPSGGTDWNDFQNNWAPFDRVDGDFTGTTDEILQWAACKWGIDEDVVRAQIVTESAWLMSTNGDNGDSYGLGQVRVPYHGNRPGNGNNGAFQNDNAVRSSAYNVDYTYAVWRGCYEGQYNWLGNTRGDLWGCVGQWFSGRFRDSRALEYIGVVQGHVNNRTWENY